MCISEMLRSSMSRKKEEKKPVAALDSAQADPCFDGASDYAGKDYSLRAASAVQQWAETDDLDDGESFADRLMSLVVGIVDSNKDGEITPDEQELLDIVLNSAWDYLVKLGVSDDDASALLNDWDADAGERVRDLVASVLPEGEEAAGDDLDDFAFGSGDQEPALDAAYKKVIAVRGGKKVRINKRISGTVRLSGKQKMAIKKMQIKSHGAVATMRRMKSLRIRRKSGL